MTTKLRVALVFGGRSGEHEVSVVSARSVSRAIDRGRYEVIPMAIDRAGKWADAELARTVLEGSGDRADQVLPFNGAVRLDPRLVDGSVDLVLPVLHGPYGEDGSIQGLCEILDLSYAGCSMAGCAVAMDKVLTKRLLVQAGLPTPRFVVVEAASWHDDRAGCATLAEGLPLPWFVKPARLGSSVGITKVSDRGSLDGAVELALRYDELVIVEEGIDAREIEVAVLDGDPPVTSVAGEIVPGHEFYDYADKYLDDACELLAPAPLREAEEREVQRLAMEAFRAVGCDGMARVDFLLDRRDGRILINELNTIPGFTSISMYPRLLAISGVPYTELLDRLIAFGLRRHERRRGRADAALRPFEQRIGRDREP